jgi:hypothetical protein
MTDGTASSPARARNQVRRTLLIMAAITLAPVVASYSIYYLRPRDMRVNYGELIAAPAPAVDGVRDDGGAFALSDLRGKWVLLQAAGDACDAPCERRLYATRQARTMQGRDQDRVARVILVTSADALAPALRAAHPNADIVRVAPAVPGTFPAGAAGIYLIDPLGNLVLAWPPDPDIKALAKDLGRLLRASQIG